MTITGSMGEIYGVLKLPTGDGPWPLVILSHGYGGNHTANQDYADALTRAGFATYNYDFCGGGRQSRSAGSMEEMSVLTEAQDLSAIIDVFLEDDRFSSISLWGESQGGFVSSYVAGMRPEDVKALVAFYPANVLQDDAEKRRLPDGSFPEMLSLWGNPLPRKYNEDAVSFDIYEVIAQYKGPVLIIHGDRDSIVPLRYSEQAQKTFPNARLIVMPGSDHGFAGVAREEAKKFVLAFLQSWIRH